MPKETNRERLELLLRMLRDPAPNVVRVSDRALIPTSGELDDLGLVRLLPEMAPPGQKEKLKEALAAFLDGGGSPNRIEYTYEDRDSETIYEFRLPFHGEKIYVKTELKDADSEDPTLVVRSVKRQN
jgi:hypothetical protein